MRTLKHDPICGTHISEAAAAARRLAKRERLPVLLDFNGIALRVTPKRSVTSVVAEFEQRSEERSLAYQKSPAGKKAERERQERLAKDQAAVDVLVGPERLDGISISLDAAVHWVRDFAAVADNRYLRYDKAAVVAALEAAGYRASARVGLPSWFFFTKRRCGEYVIGQALDCMKHHDLPPHPGCTHRFVEDYEKAVDLPAGQTLDIVLGQEAFEALRAKVAHEVWVGIRRLCEEAIREAGLTLVAKRQFAAFVSKSIGVDMYVETVTHILKLPEGEMADFAAMDLHRNLDAITRRIAEQFLAQHEADLQREANKDFDKSQWLTGATA